MFPLSALIETGWPVPDFNDSVRVAGMKTDAVRLRCPFRIVGCPERFDTEVRFVERIDLPYYLLGRRGVFARFRRVCFVEHTEPHCVELVL